MVDCDSPQIMGSKEMGCRFWHTTVVSQSSSRMRQLLTFGGCPGAPESHTTGSWPKMADTVLMEMGRQDTCIHCHWRYILLLRSKEYVVEIQHVRVFFATSTR
jgi:hypothetical protein